MSEHQVFVREAGEVEFDILFVTENVNTPQGPRPLSLEDLHALIKDATGRYTYLNFDGIMS